MWIKWLIGLFSGDPYYVRINSKRLSIRNVITGDMFDCKPTVELDAADVVVSIGGSGNAAVVRVVKPFEHPRIVIADFAAAEKVLQHAVRSVSGTRWLRPAPVFVIHPDSELAGGLSTIEERALYELGEETGARKTHVHYGRPLTDQEVRDLAGA